MFKFDLLLDEKVLNIYRQTEAVLFKPVILVFALIYTPWYFLLKYELANKYSRLLLLWTILIFLYALNKYLLWLLNVYIITNKRLIAINYFSLFNKKVLETPLDRILNVSFTSKGIWANLSKTGSVESQINGLREPIVFKNISHPSTVKDFIWSIHLKAK